MPLFFDLRGKRALVVGAGPVGVRRARILADFGASVRMVAPECTAPEEPGEDISWERRAFRPDDVGNCILVIAATNDEKLNTRIAGLCRDWEILVNHAGDQSQCDFFFPAVVREKDVVIGVTSSGTDHHLVRRLAEELRTWLKGKMKD